MTENDQINSKAVIKTLWLGMLGSPASLWLVLVLMDRFSLIQTLEFAYADYIFFTGLATIPVSAALLRSFSKTNRLYISDRRDSINENDTTASSLKQSMIIGMAVADIPASISIVYYMMSGDLEKSVLLVASSFILCYFYKPDLSVRGSV